MIEIIAQFHLAQIKQKKNFHWKVNENTDSAKFAPSKKYFEE